MNMREQLVKHLNGGEAFTPIDKFLDEITFDQLGVRPKDLPYSFYELFYHITYAQKDILDFIVADSYKAPDWPDEYWPKKQSPQNKEEWEELKEAYFNDRKKLSAYMLDQDNDLLEPVKNGEDQTLLRELMLVIEHTAYHTGQLLVILRLLDLH